MNNEPLAAEITHIKQLIPDDNNSRQHTPRNIGMIVDSLHEVGAARSIVIDENNKILAGNGTIEAAAEAGIEKLKVVEADGNEIIAVRRTGLSERQKQRLSLLDNRTAELADWDSVVLRDMAAKDSTVLSGLFSEQETENLIGKITKDLQETILDQAIQIEPGNEYFVVLCRNEEEFTRLRTALNLPLVRRGGYKPGSPFDDTGVQRVVNAADLLEKLSC